MVKPEIDLILSETKAHVHLYFMQRSINFFCAELDSIHGFVGHMISSTLLLAWKLPKTKHTQVSMGGYDPINFVYGHCNLSYMQFSGITK